MRIRRAHIALAFAVQMSASGCHRTQMAVRSPANTFDTGVRTRADSIRCAVVRDSVDGIAWTELAIRRPNRNFPLPKPPADAQDASPIHTQFLVRPDGTVDTATVIITGSKDARYRANMVRTLSRERFAPNYVQGCAVTGRGDIVVVRMKGAMPRPGLPPNEDEKASRER